MPFDYYRRLSPARQAIYRASDAVTRLEVPRPETLQPLAADLEEALSGGGRAAVASAAGALVGGLFEQLRVPAVRVRVLSLRPSNATSELHGLYEAVEGETPVITVWMRTAARGQVVAFRTFLRTLLHEACHHLDHELLDLRESFHTEGFLKRESSLVRLLAPAKAPLPPGRARTAPPPSPPRAGPKRRRRSRRVPEGQLALPWETDGQ